LWRGISPVTAPKIRIGTLTVFVKNHIVGNQTDEFIDLDEDLISAALERIQSGTISYTETDELFIGFVISFPGSSTNITVSYAVNQVAESAYGSLRGGVGGGTAVSLRREDAHKDYSIVS
jgi:hypothetical protein